MVKEQAKQEVNMKLAADRSLLGLFFIPKDGRDMFLRNVELILNGLCGVISQEIEQLI
jgi:hypothetical protein